MPTLKYNIENQDNPWKLFNNLAYVYSEMYDDIFGENIDNQKETHSPALDSNYEATIFLHNFKIVQKYYNQKVVNASING